MRTHGLDPLLTDFVGDLGPNRRHHMRLNRNAQALTAYDSALAVNPKEYISLYGRGLVEARLGRATEAVRDMAKALAARPYIRDDFVGMEISK